MTTMILKIIKIIIINKIVTMKISDNIDNSGNNNKKI